MRLGLIKLKRKKEKNEGLVKTRRGGTGRDDDSPKCIVLAQQLSHFLFHIIHPFRMYATNVVRYDYANKRQTERKKGHR